MSRLTTAVAGATVTFITVDAVDAIIATAVTILQLKLMIMIQPKKQQRNLSTQSYEYQLYYANSKYDVIIKYVMHIITALLYEQISNWTLIA